MGWWLTRNLCNSLWLHQLLGEEERTSAQKSCWFCCTARLLQHHFWTDPRTAHCTAYLTYLCGLRAQQNQHKVLGSSVNSMSSFQAHFHEVSFTFFGWFIKPFVLDSEHYANIRFFLSYWKMTVLTCLMVAISLEENWIWTWNIFLSPIISLQGHAKINIILFYCLSFLPSQ